MRLTPENVSARRRFVSGHNILFSRVRSLEVSEGYLVEVDSLY